MNMAEEIRVLSTDLDEISELLEEDTVHAWKDLTEPEVAQNVRNALMPSTTNLRGNLDSY